MPQVIDAATGQPKDVTAEEAQAAFQAGKVQLPGGAPVHIVTPGGQVRQIDPTQAQQVIQAGGRFAKDEEVHAAKLDAKYGGLGGSLAATGEGAVRGLTFGISDPLAVGAARLFGGDEAAEKVRTHLAEEREAHPYLSTGGEIAGAIAPTLLSGGLGGAVEGGELAATAGRLGGEAGVFSRIAEGTKTIGAIPRGVSALGEGAAHLVSSLLGSEAETALGRAGQAAAKAAARGIVEGGLFGTGDQISESTLTNTPLVSEKLFANVGLSALLGGFGGAALAGGGSLLKEGAGSILEKLSPKLDEARGEQTWKWLNGRQLNLSKEAELRAGGTDAVGNTVYDEVARPIIEKEGVAGLAMSAEQKAEAVTAARQRIGSNISETIATKPDATVSLGDYVDPIQSRIDEYRGLIGGEDKVAALEKLKGSVMRILGEEPNYAEMQQIATERALDAGIQHGTPEFHAAVKDFMGEAMSEHMAQMGERQVPLAEAIRQRRSLQQIAYEESKSLDPKLRVELMRDITRDWGQLEQEALNKVSDETTGQLGDQLRALNKTYQQLKLAEQATERDVASHSTHRGFSITDYMSGIAHAPGMLLSGHPIGALGAVAASIGHKAVREHGTIYSALLLDRLASWGGISQAVAEHDAGMDRAIGRLLEGGAAERVTREKPRAANDNTKAFEKARAAVGQLAAAQPGQVKAHIDQKIAPLGMHAPQLAQGLSSTATRAAQFLASKLPPAPDPSMTLTPNAKAPPIAASARAAFLRYYDAVHEGPEAIVKKAAAGTVSAEEAETLKSVFPESFSEARVKVAQLAAERKTALEYQTRVRLSMLFDLPTDPTLAPGHVQAIQASYTVRPPGGGPKGGSAPAHIGVSKSTAGPFERAAGGE